MIEHRRPWRRADRDRRFEGLASTGGADAPRLLLSLAETPLVILDVREPSRLVVVGLADRVAIVGTLGTCASDLPFPLDGGAGFGEVGCVHRSIHSPSRRRLLRINEKESPSARRVNR